MPLGVISVLIAEHDRPSSQLDPPWLMMKRRPRHARRSRAQPPAREESETPATTERAPRRRRPGPRSKGPGCSG
eukprot:15462448-Alexandrium_andersonii.AAC.1